MKKSLRLGSAVLLLTQLGLSGCGQQQNTPALPRPPAELHIFNWADYITQSTLDEFSRRSGCKVFLHVYSSTDEMLSLLKSNPAGYDVVVMEDRMISALAELKLIQKINPRTIEGYAHLDPEFTNLPSDPGNQYSIPYLWGTTLIAYRSDRLKPEPSWASLFNPQWADEVLMLDDGRECFEMALRALGQSSNRSDPQGLKKATELLKKQATQIQGYADVYEIKEALLNGRCALAPIYSGDAVEIASKEANIKYFIPQEGAAIWIDAFTLSRDAPNVETAKDFIEFMLDPEVAAANASALWYASANLKAKAFMDPAILENEALFPSEEVRARLEFIRPLAESKRALLNKNWNAVQRLSRSSTPGDE